jgi:tetratricopeptide (TPR) repeat protein/CHAT domain-containing protein
MMLHSLFPGLSFFLTSLFLVGAAVAQPSSNDLAALDRQIMQLYQSGNYAEALPLAKHAVALTEKAYGPNHPNVATALNNLASLYGTQGRYAEAEPLYKRALAVREKALGPAHLAVAHSLYNLAGLYRNLGRYGEAEPLYKRALSIREKALGAEHSDVGQSLDGLALVYQDQARYAEAEPLYKRALAIREKALGRDHTEVGISLNNLAELYRTQGRYAEAEPLFKRSLAIYEKALGPSHPNVGTLLSNLALLYYIQGRYPEAEPLYKRDLAITEKARGPDHPDVGNSLNNLAVLYQAQGRYAEAEPLYKRALAISEKALGPDHSDVAVRINSLAGFYQAQGSYAEAEPLYKRALAVRERALGPNHPDVSNSLNSLAELYRIQGRYAEAEPLLKRSLAIHEKAFGPDHPDVAARLNNLALLYDSQGRYREAEPLYKRGLAIREKSLGPNHPAVGTSLNNLAALYDIQGRYAEAEPLFKRALVISEKALGPDHPAVAIRLNNLASLYQDQHLYAEAEKLYKRSLAIDEKALGAEHPSVATDLSNLAYLHFVQRDWARAADFWRRSTGVIISRAQRTTLVGQALTGKRKSEAEQLSFEFWLLIKAAYRLASDQRRLDEKLASEMFQTAQWAQSSEAAQSLRQMAARGAKGDPHLAALVRDRQDLVTEWQQRDAERSTAVAQAPNKRNSQAEAANMARLGIIDTRIAEIDNRLNTDFPDYAALVSPSPLSVEGVQAQLGPDEALILILDTPKRSPTPEETFLWVVTKTEARWARSEIGTQALRREVAALRCGLDYDGTWGAEASPCGELLKINYTESDHREGRPLPFDLGRAHALYKALFGEVEDIIKDKHLLIVPSGALTKLPFQVLVTRLSGDPPSDERLRRVGHLGASLRNLTPEARQSLMPSREHGVRIVKIVPKTPAEAAGLKPDDILLSIDGEDFASAQKFADAVGSHAPGSTIRLRVLRAGTEIVVTATLDNGTVRDWVPRMLTDAEGKDVAWLARNHALTVLPVVSSLKALRQLAKASHASRTLIGFGNPLLDGPNIGYAELASEARSKQSCPKAREQRVAALTAIHRGVLPLSLRGGLVNVADIRAALPLPETADELCAVAHDLGVRGDEIRLGGHATEAELKRLSAAGELAKYRIIHFATHGALAGEIGEGSEPGLLLTPPEQATETDDGYLSASEIAALKLDADWVILSACNTAAGGAEGAEALSGLARAFFYAGARTLLVSHWYVDSEATVALITKSFDALKADPKIGRAEALRRAMGSLIADGGRTAHPSAWAPFVVVGEGGAGK